MTAATANGPVRVSSAKEHAQFKTFMQPHSAYNMNINNPPFMEAMRLMKKD